MKLLIIGGTGKTGQELIKQALERGHTLTVLVRSPEKIKSMDTRVQIFKGDVLDHASLPQAMAGQEAVLSALGHKKWIIRSTILSEGTKNIINAMQKHSVSRFICISSLGVNDSKFRMGLYYTLFVIPFLLFYYFKDKAKQERQIQESSLKWTIVRPGHFLPAWMVRIFHGKERGRYRTGEKIGNLFLTPVISRADVAHFMLEQLENDIYIHRTPGIAY
ncbi:MAG: NAD(P)-dependent oxidoreductase [Chitinophagaceae bacterium]